MPNTQDIQVNAKTIYDIAPEDMLSYFHRRYDGIVVPKEIDFFQLTKVEQMLALIANEKGYLNFMKSIADIMTRSYKAAGDKEKYASAVCKKNIIDNYIDTLESKNKAISRMLTVYQLEREDINYENRLAGAVYGA